MKKKTYDKAFKEHAVNLWLGSGKSAQEVADELGIKRDRLYTWKEARPAVPPGGKVAPRPTGTRASSWSRNWLSYSAKTNGYANSGTF